MFKLNNKGFSLVELLGAMVILIIFFSIAVIGVGRIIRNSNKDAYVDIAKAYSHAFSENDAFDDYGFDDEDTVFFVDPRYLNLDSSKEYVSPFGDFLINYLVITYDGKKFNKYFVSADSEGWGVKLNSTIDNLRRRDVVIIEEYDYKAFDYAHYGQEGYSSCSNLKSMLVNNPNASNPYAGKNRILFVDKDGGEHQYYFSDC